MSVAQAELLDVELALKRVKADLKSGRVFIRYPHLRGVYKSGVAEESEDP